MAVVTAPARVARSRWRLPHVTVGSVLLYGVLIILSLIFLLPFYIMVRNAFMTDLDITSPAFQFWPSTIQWGNISELFGDPDVPILTRLRLPGFMAVAHDTRHMAFASMPRYRMPRNP